MHLIPIDLTDDDALRGLDEHTKALYLRALTLMHQYRAPWPIAIAAIADADQQTEADDARAT